MKRNVYTKDHVDNASGKAGLIAQAAEDPRRRRSELRRFAHTSISNYKRRQLSVDQHREESRNSKHTCDGGSDLPS